MRAALLCNPFSGRIAPRIDRIRRQAASLPAVYRETTSLAGMRQAVDACTASGVDMLAIAGGDVTVQAVLDHLLGRGDPAAMPQIVIIPGGTTNMTALDLGFRGGPVAVLGRVRDLLAGRRAGRRVERHVLRVAPAGGPAVHGMFFGAGAIVTAARYFHLRVRRSGVTGEIASLAVILRYLAGMLAGRAGSELPPARARLSAGDDRREEDCLLLFASTLDRLLLGMRPYWGGGADPVHVTLIRSSPSRFWRSLPSLVRGKGARLAEADGYYSADFLRLEI